VRIFGIDPGSDRTGYGCVETDGRRHHLIVCGAIAARPGDSFPDRLERIHRELTALLAACRPASVALENLFHSSNARSALKLGHARGVAMLAAVQAGCPVAEYTPAEVKRAIVGYGRAEKRQVQQMIKLLLGLEKVPTPHDAADALAVAICHLHSLPAARVRLKPDTTRNRLTPGAATGSALNDRTLSNVVSGSSRTKASRSWRHYRPPTG
jgi:crossover junction endodeoxyribonuclease RuvC